MEAYDISSTKVYIINISTIVVKRIDSCSFPLLDEPLGFNTKTIVIYKRNYTLSILSFEIQLEKKHPTFLQKCTQIDKKN